MADQLPLTEADSLYNSLESMPLRNLLEGINEEDHKVPKAIAGIIPQIEVLVEAIVKRMKDRGRLFYIGAGTSGRLGIVDASECPPTFGVPHGMVIGLIAGGDTAIRKAVEFAEDNKEQAWIDLQAFSPTVNDFVVGIAASGRTPYVIGGLEMAQKEGLGTGCITCSPGSAVGKAAEFPVEVSVGPEFLTGSTRMKAGTAQKLILNMISTAAMIQLGRVKGNKMVDMQLSNIKLQGRAARMVASEIGVSLDEATKLLEQWGSVRKVIENYGK